MQVVVVEVASDGGSKCATATRSAAAQISRSLSQQFGLVHGCYITLQCGSTRPRVFRVAVDTNDQAAARSRDAVFVDHWPQYADEPADLRIGVKMEAFLTVVSPARLRVAQYVALHPSSADPPKLPVAMAKVLLRKLILHEPSGVVTLQLQGVDYGDWRYKVYYRGSGTKGRRRGGGEAPHNTELDDWVLDAGIVTDGTMVALSPFSSTERDVKSLVRPNGPGLGVHGEPLRNLLSLALFPPSDSLAKTTTSVMQPRSILIHGPSGSGKTTLTRLVARQLDVNVLSLDCSMLATPHLRIEDVFTAALRIQPSLVLLEDLELIFPRALDETKYKLVCRFVACLDRLRSMTSSHVAVVGNVTTLRALNTKIHQVFEEELALEVPEKAWTVRLFESHLPSPDAVSDELKFAVAVKFGQRPSNVVALAHRLVQHKALSDGPDAARTRTEIERLGREIAATTGSTTALQTSVPSVRWQDIGGLASVKQNLMEMVVWPLEKPQVFLRMGISPPLGMLLYGPPGTGKTMLAKAAARASGCNFLNVSASDLMMAEFGESEKAITRVFDAARALSPCMVFIDEFQSLFGNRSTAGLTTSRMISQLLMEMDAVKALADGQYDDRSASSTLRNRVFVLAATNALNAIDPAFLQPGRFENVLHVGLPTVDERRAILELQRTKMPWHDDVDVNYLAQMTDGANAASIVALCQAAAIQAMQRIEKNTANSQLIAMQDFVLALQSGHFDFRPEPTMR